MAILCGLFCGSIALNMALGILLYIKIIEDNNVVGNFTINKGCNYEI